jgi:hypothetical protein
VKFNYFSLENSSGRSPVDRSFFREIPTVSPHSVKEEKIMLAVLGDYLKNIDSEIESYEKLIAAKREEARKLTRLQGQVVEALGTLREIVDELSSVDPESVSVVRTAALQIFGEGDGKGETLPDENSIANGKTEIETLPTSESESGVKPESNGIPIDSDGTITVEVVPERTEEARDGGGEESESVPPEEESESVRLSASVLHDPGASIALAGINARDRAKAWGEWLCLTHTVGERFEIRNGSHSEGFTYDLVIFGISPEDTRRLAAADLTRSPQALDNASWQPAKRLPPAAEPRPKVCRPGDLAVSDIARKEDGREYRVTGVSDDGSIVKVVNGDGLDMSLPVGALYLTRKATPEPGNGKANPSPGEDLANVVNAFNGGKSGGSGLEAGDRVRIRSGRFGGKYEGREGTVAREPRGFGVDVNVGEDKPVFFLKDEISTLD